MPLTAPIRAAVFSALAALTLAGPAALPARAQAPAAPSGSSAALGLSAAQRAKADAREAQFRKDLSALQADPKMTTAQKQAKYTGLYQAMDRDMLTILTPAQRTQVLKQRQINVQFQKDILALQSDKKMTEAQKKARYLQLVQSARNSSLALLPPAQRAEALKRSQAAEQAQQAQAAKIAEARRLSQQLQQSETPAQSQKLKAIAATTGAALQAVMNNKSLSDKAKTDKIVALRQDALKRDMALLTPAQRTLYTRIQATIAPLTHPAAP